MTFDSHNGEHRAGNRALRPFLKWAGGKRQLLPVLREFYPESFGKYHEPFLGSGAVFFDLADRLTNGRARLTDVNADLIGCWLRLRDSPDAVIAGLRRLATGYHKSPNEHFYRVRNDEFNPARSEIMNGNGVRAEAYTSDLAAMFIYLNRTGYNGLFRLNSTGQFNVPRGRYRNPRICDEGNLQRVSSILCELSVEIEHASFDVVLQSASADDFIYFDPPYAPLSTTAQFTSYTAGGFGAEDQRELQRIVLGLVSKGCHVVLSNSTAPQVQELYGNKSEAKKLHLDVHTVPARRAINSKASRRGPVEEYIITNVRKRTA